MLRGIYQAAAGMKARLAVQDIIANNLANAGTAGFQREVASIQAQMLPVPDPTGAPPGAAGPQGNARQAFLFLRPYSTTDMREGVLQRTGTETDVALDGPGYLVAQTGRGVRLTRGGPLRVNAQGHLATLGGDPLLSAEGQPIPVGSKSWQVAPDGTVTVAGAQVGRLRIAQPTGPTQREGATLLSTGGLQDVPAGSVRVLQGFLEHSNVETVREMVDMIAGVRAYESAERALQAQDETLQNLLDAVRTP